MHTQKLYSICWLWVDTNPISGASGSGFLMGSFRNLCGLRRVIIIIFTSIYLFFFFLSAWYVCLLAKLACQVKFKQILLEQLWLFMGKWLDPLTVSILNFYAFIFMTVILMKKHFKPPLKWRKYHSSTLTHRPRHRPRPKPELKLKLNLKAPSSSQVATQAHSLFCIHICVLWVFIALSQCYMHVHIWDLRSPIVSCWLLPIFQVQLTMGFAVSMSTGRHYGALDEA